MNGKKYNILLVEDDEIDQENVQRGLAKVGPSLPLTIAGDGLEALEKLRAGIPTPLIILLDLKMPRMNGLEFLRVLRQDDRWKNYPVIVLTSSREEKDLVEAYKLSVAGYILKPLEPIDFIDILDKIGKYWAISEFPVKQ